jgi:hypothetical protein
LPQHSPQRGHSLQYHQISTQSSSRKLSYSTATLTTPFATSVGKVEPELDNEPSLLHQEKSSYSERQYTAHRSPISRRRAKRSRVSPGSQLVESLRQIAAVEAVPQQDTKKLDLSYHRPASAQEPLAWAKVRGRYARGSVNLSCQHGHEEYISQSLPGILAAYLKISQGPFPRKDSVWDADTSLERLFSHETCSYLQSKGYGPSDVVSWAWIITSTTAERALLRLAAYSKELRKNQLSSNSLVPKFLLFLILRRERLNATALRMVLTILSNNIVSDATLSVDTSESASFDSTDNEKRISDFLSNISVNIDDDASMAVMTVRLIRLARAVWPASLVEIARIYTAGYVGRDLAMVYTSVGGRKKGGQRVSYLTSQYNRILGLLAEPSSIRPYVSMQYHQRAQVVLLRRMANFDPPIHVTREGYRAVAIVQLSRPKTERERNWALMKAKSWPPWKQERTGLDALTGPEEGMSRATDVINKLQKAGYEKASWEDQANILGGWDTDGTPTIQTRYILRRQEPSSVIARSSKLWAARISATRTLEEAWACFLAWSELRGDPIMSVFHAMFNKQIYHRKLLKTSTSSSRAGIGHEEESLLPGDGREISLAPISPREAIYVSTPPPSLDQLLEQMISAGLKPSGSTLVLLIQNAESWEDGVRYLGSGHHSSMSNMALTDLAAAISTAYIDGKLTDHQTDLIRNVPESLFVAIVRLLCRFPHLHMEDYSTYPPQRIHGTLPRSMDLVLIRKPKHRRAYNVLLSALARPGVLVDKSIPRHHRSEQDVEAWNVSRKLVRQMDDLNVELDHEGFLYLCRCFEKALVASLVIQRDPSASPKEINYQKFLIKECNYLKYRFEKTFGGSKRESKGSTDALQFPRTDNLPLLTAVLGPAEFHAFVRVLGITRNFLQLNKLLNWMMTHQQEHDEICHEIRNGKRMRRQAIVAVRVFLENFHLRYQSSYGSSEAAREVSEDLRYHPTIDIAAVVDEEAFTDQLRGGWPEELSVIAGSPAAESRKMQIRRIIEKVPEWGGWPSDDEVEAYCLYSATYENIDKYLYCES